MAMCTSKQWAGKDDCYVRKGSGKVTARTRSKEGVEDTWCGFGNSWERTA